MSVLGYRSLVRRVICPKSSCADYESDAKPNPYPNSNNNPNPMPILWPFGRTWGHRKVR